MRKRSVGSRKVQTISLDLIRANEGKSRRTDHRYRRGASRLVDALIDTGSRPSRPRLSKKALASAAARLGARGAKVRWIVET